MKINIAGGSGKMGKVHRPVFEVAGHEVIISGRSSSPSLEEAAAQSDLTIVSVPIHATEETIRRVAPHCRDMMDFTSVKEFPINSMLSYSKGEVGGLHPLYGNVPSIAGRTVVYCPTERSGNACEEIVRSLREAGANIKVMNPRAHDRFVNGELQNARVILFKTFGLLMANSGMSVQEAYSLSPPPTKAILDLLARQSGAENDEMYTSMITHNPSMGKILGSLRNYLKDAHSDQKTPFRIRKWFGENELEEAQKRAKRLVCF